MTQTFHLLCAGAVQGLVKALQPEFEARSGCALVARYGAVGGQKDALLSGAPCDLMIVTAAMVDALISSGHLVGATRTDIGRVKTGVAMRAGETLPEVTTPEALAATLQAADEIYFPDPERATAGIHFAAVMRELGLLETLRPRFRTFASGAISMREMAASRVGRAVGCTQVTEILYTEGVALAGLLPARFELATTYTAAVSSRAALPTQAQALTDLLTAGKSLPLRQAGGFES